jgi:ATP-binding cassette subfamily C protein CydD
MGKRSFAGAVWLIDVLGAALLALGLAHGIAGIAEAGAAPAAALAAVLLGGMIRAGGAVAVHALAIRAAARIVAPLRHRLFLRLTATAGPLPPLGEAAVIAIDHPATVEAYHARFVPARLAAALAPLIVIGLVALASLVAAAILLMTLLPFILGLILAGGLARRSADRQLAAIEALSGLFVDRVRMLPLIRHFGAEARIARQAAAAARDVADRTVAVLRTAFVSNAVLEFFAALAVALVAVYCGFGLLGLLPVAPPETLTLREAFFALAMAPEFYLPMRRLAAAYHDKQLGEAALAAIAALPPAPPDPAGPPYAGVTLAGATIRFPGRTIGPVDFALGRTGLVAITGPTGSGKSSVLAAIAGMLPLTAGAVTAIDPDSIAWAAQRPLLLPDTLAANLALARPDAAAADLDRAVAAVGLAPLVAARGTGLELRLDHRGSGLSGGERRRLGLARALVADRPLLLCDEPTADLDAASAARIVALLAAEARRRAVIVATHDPRLVAVAQKEVRL